MARTLKLHIIPQETFPTQRPNNCAPQGVAQEVGDMPQMAAFVYEFYIQKVQAMKSAFYGAQKVWQKPGAHKAVIPEHFVSHHPGADDDTDSEEEQERIKSTLKQEQEEVTTEEDQQKTSEMLEESES